MNKPRMSKDGQIIPEFWYQIKAESKNKKYIYTALRNGADANEAWVNFKKDKPDALIIDIKEVGRVASVT